MTAAPSGRPTEEERARRALLRRANLYLAGLVAFTVGVGLAGTALIALVITRGRGGFLPLWGLLAAVVIVPPALVTLWRVWRDDGKRPSDEAE